MQQDGTRHAFEVFPGEVVRTAHTRCAVTPLIGFSLGSRDHLADRLERGARVDHQHAATATHVAEHAEGLVDVISHLAHVGRDRERAAVKEVQGIAIGGRLGDQVHGHTAGVAGLVVDDDGLAQQRLQGFGQRASTGIGRPPWRVAHHDPNGFVGIGLGLGKAGPDGTPGGGQ